MAVFHEMLGMIVVVFVDAGVVAMEQKHLETRQE